MEKYRKILVCAIVCVVYFFLCKTEIYAAQTPNPAYVISGGDYTTTENGVTTIWMKADNVCTINAPINYTISPVADGTFGSSITVSKDWVPTVIYLKDENGAVSPAVTITESFYWDVTPPTGSICIDGINQVFQNFVTSPTETLFYKSQKSFTIAGNDTESGICKVEYLVSNTPLDINTAINSNQYTVSTDGKINHEMNGINYVYVRLTDYVGNQSVISTDGMVFYEDAQANTTTLFYAKDSVEWLEAYIFSNDNTIKQIAIGQTILSHGIDYAVNDDGMITFYPSAFSGLDLGKYFVTVSCNPLGYTYVDVAGNEAPLEITMMLSVVNSKDLWGTPVVNSGVTNYVALDGTTSAEVTGQEMIWLKETSGGTSAWYGLDNRAGTFEAGSRFWVKWLDDEENADAWNTYYDRLDREFSQKVEDDHIMMFEVGVTAPNGTKYTNLGGNVPIYVQIGDDWDAEDLKAVYISENRDENIALEAGNVMYPDGTDRYAKLTLNHFSPYVVYDELTDAEKATQNTSGASGQGAATSAEAGGAGAPATTIPPTGDASNIHGMLWLMMISLCGMMAVGLLITTRSR